MKHYCFTRLYFFHCTPIRRCARCIRSIQPLTLTTSIPCIAAVRLSSTTTTQHVSESNNNNPKESPEPEQSEPTNQQNPTEGAVFDEDDIGYMKRRLLQLAEEASPIKDDPMAGRASNDDFMSVKELNDLQERLSAQTFKQEHAQTIAAAQLPASASKQTRDLAFSKPWTGTESTEDAVLRMLVDANKPLRIPGAGSAQGSYRKAGGAGAATGGSGNPIPHPKMKRSTPASVRLARARELSLEYSIAKNTGVPPDTKDKEKNSANSSGQVEEDKEFSRLYRDRFRGPRAMPGTLHGLRALADERIEEARARGQFNNLPRGGKLDMDARISSPFLDTTEFFLNRIIQRQDVQPPWIDKQATIRQDLRRFRIELRESWKRHAMQLIAAESPNLEEQVARAKEYAEAEQAEAERLGIHTEKDTDGETIHSSEEGGHEARTASSTETLDHREVPPVIPITSISSSVLPKHDWELIERKYHELSVKTLNDNIRSYNLMAPEPARRPYLTLERELRLCYAEVAPLLADALRERHDLIKAKRTTFSLTKTENKRSVLDNLFGEKVVIMEKTGNEYGLKELFRDLIFRKKSSSV
ncbi:hypothetical protein V1525DRAFT_457710 [Lipomyces kononenkoae]|uniref:Uncharacterized protein n=1 Tax=Lipomyces kononenkoae TaxID=34357 RepID=A0ACC3SXH0_LIPKO